MNCPQGFISFTSNILCFDNLPTATFSRLYEIHHFLPFTVNRFSIQESPPAWTQEAYRPLCSPILADPPPPADWPDPPTRLDLSPPHWLDLTPLLAGPEPPPLAGPDPPCWLDLTPPLPAGSDPPASWTWPPRLDLTPPPPAGLRTDPPRCGQTNKVKLLPSRCTTYAGGNNH